MKQLISIPVNGYLFWKISRPAPLKHCIGQYGRHLSAAMRGREIHQEVFRKSGPDSKKPKNIHIGKRFASNAQSYPALMNFEVWLGPNIFKFFYDRYKFANMLEKYYSISINEFIKSSETALLAVTSLLSQLRFTELEGLLSQECIEEVKKNLQDWPETSFLAVKTEYVVQAFPCDPVIVPDEENKEKKIFQVRMIYFVNLEIPSKTLMRKFHPQLADKIPESTVSMLAVYNCMFISDFTNAGVNSEWIINKINLKVLF